MWVDAFYNFTTIFVSFFGKDALDFHVAFAKFYSCIYKLLTVYNWQKAVFSMAIEAHTFIVTQQPIDPLKWIISNNFFGKFYMPKTIKKMSSIMETGNKKNRSKFSSSSKPRIKILGRSNNLSITYNLFNKGGCN